MGNEVLNNIIKKVESLPTLPMTYHRISELIRKPTTCAMDIAEVISKDQALTARLLKMVNSAFYGFSGKINTVSGAVVMMGFKSIKSLVLSSSVIDLFKEKKANPFLDPVLFWKHSLSVAVGCKIIAKYVDHDDPEEFFVAGILHDIGKLIQNQYLRASFLSALEHAHQNKLPLHQSELKVLGISHCEIGLLLAEKWKLPECIKESIAFHHSPGKARRFPVFASIVHLSNILVKALELGNSGDQVVSPVSTNAWECLHLSEAIIEPVMEKLLIDTEEVGKLLNPLKENHE